MANIVDTNEFKHNPARESLLNRLNSIVDAGDDIIAELAYYMTNDEYTMFVNAITAIDDLRESVRLDYYTCGNERVM